MKERPLISAARRVDYLVERGVRFDIMSPERALEFLRNNIFFFKNKTFAKCRGPASENRWCYVNLDFARLAKLAMPGRHLRELFFSMTLGIERYMKVHINRTMMDGSAEGRDPRFPLCP